MYGAVKRRLGDVFHQLVRLKECEIEEGHIMPDHVHMLISMPPKLSVSSVIEDIKGQRESIAHSLQTPPGLFLSAC